MENKELKELDEEGKLPTKKQLKNHPDCKRVIYQDNDGNIYHYISKDGWEIHQQPRTNSLNRLIKSYQVKRKNEKTIL